MRNERASEITKNIPSLRLRTADYGLLPLYLQLQLQIQIQLWLWSWHVAPGLWPTASVSADVCRLVVCALM